MTTRITGDAFGVGFDLASECADFARFVRHNYRVFQGPTPRHADLTVDFGPLAGATARARREAMRHVGMGVWVDDQALYWENEFGFALLLEPDARGFTIAAYHFDLDNPLEADARDRNFQRSMRWAMHLPLFHLLAERDGLGLTHASAVAREDGTILAFCGLNKVGKSTLGAYLAGHGYRFVTDNFLLLNGEAVFGFPEALRLTPDSVEHLGLEPTWDDTVYGKHHVGLAEDRVCLSGAPKAFFFVTNGPEPAVEPLEGERAALLMAGLHQYLGEFPEQSYLAALPLVTGRPLAGPRPADTLLRDRPWFQLTLPRDWALGEVQELIERCI